MAHQVLEACQAVPTPRFDRSKVAIFEHRVREFERADLSFSEASIEGFFVIVESSVPFGELLSMRPSQ